MTRIWVVQLLSLSSIFVCVQHLHQVSSMGIFQLRITSFNNDNGVDQNGDCCSRQSEPKSSSISSPSSSSSSSSASSASSSYIKSSNCTSFDSNCRTLFRICLSHYQSSIPPHPACNFGSVITPVLGNNSFNTSSLTSSSSILSSSLSSSSPASVVVAGNSRTDISDGYLVNIPFDFSWPGSFSLIIEAWNDISGTAAPSQGSPILGTAATHPGSSGSLITRLATQRILEVGRTWQTETFSSRALHKLIYKYRVVCVEHYYGAGCSDMCTPRDDVFGHYTCNETGARICLSGWKGPYCDTAICLDGCNGTHGFCDSPFQCKCRLGWQGRSCDQCVTYPGCQHGVCEQPWQCICRNGWGGLFCNQDLNFCTNNRPCRNGATCSNTGKGSYTCICQPGFTGTNCEMKVSDCRLLPCYNSATCQPDDLGTHVCACPRGYYGVQCELKADSCSDSPCRNGGTCNPMDAASTSHPASVTTFPSGASFRCQCPAGFTGFNCEVEIDECLSKPCLNGGRCIDDRVGYRCACPAGYVGERCEESQNDCSLNPCLNGATCADNVDGFICHCTPGFGGPLCQYDCLTLPCLNGGSCVRDDATDIFRCRCPAKFTGENCSQEIDPCRADPCSEGTVCRERFDGYDCVCPDGYEGIDCGVRTPDHDDTSFSNIDAVAPPLANESSKMAALVDADSSATQRMTMILIVCLGIVLPLLLLACVAVFVVFYRRLANKRNAEQPPPPQKQQKMNNIVKELERGGSGGGVKEVSKMEVLLDVDRKRVNIDRTEKDMRRANLNLTQTNDFEDSRKTTHKPRLSSIENNPSSFGRGGDNPTVPSRFGRGDDGAVMSAASRQSSINVDRYTVAEKGELNDNECNNDRLENNSNNRGRGHRIVPRIPANNFGFVYVIENDPTSSNNAIVATEV